MIINSFYSLGLKTQFFSKRPELTFHSQQMTGNIEVKVSEDLRVINKGLQIELDNKVNKATK